MPKNFFTTEQQSEIVNAIKQAEKRTSGEIKIHIEKKCNAPVLEHASVIFEQLGIGNTVLQNGVLIYMSIEDRKIAILGDKGIDKVVPNDFWESIYTSIKQKFKEGAFTQGLVNAISQTGVQLQAYFPLAEGDKNELSDEISFGE
ncbi:MAG: TPM domain-containing protein [Pseudarcicella sp.]|nr:TPM domain-containing protein [Pseudarcicella sp.]MBP6410394.1 TPM domain-containing protein [Pseudarcicella sp.]